MTTSMKILAAMVIACASASAAVTATTSAGAGIVAIQLEVTPTEVTPPGSANARVTLTPSTATNTVSLSVPGTEAQIGSPVLFNGGWVHTCTGIGTNAVTCPYTNGSYPLVLDFPITVPSDVAATTWRVFAEETSQGGGSRRDLTILAPPATSTPSTSSTTSTSTPTSDVTGVDPDGMETPDPATTTRPPSSVAARPTMASPTFTG